VLICNAFNLIDGVDGLAAGSALASTLTMFGVSLYTHNHTVALLAVVLAGAIAGFLRYNFSPATIFLGDCGSLLLGFLLAAFSLTGATQQKSTTVFAAAIPVVAFGFPIVETLVSILRRFISGQPVFRADRQHIHHRLMELGISPVGVATLVYGISALCGLFSLALLSPGAAPIAVVLTVFGILAVVGLQRLYYNEVIEFGRFARYSLRQRRTIPNNLVVRQASQHISTASDFPAVCALLEDAFGACEFDAFSLELFSRRNRHLVHHWVRDSVSAQPLDIMGFKLLRRDRSLCGELTLSRSDASPLMLDLNLITAELRPALEQSVDRLFDEIPEKGRVIPFLRLEAQG
jgi:UDP-GlcNAc:undecaprenyl-phosphate/decaprenyl-phosphate GlcNAc-1-phosphate transferase